MRAASEGEGDVREGSEGEEVRVGYEGESGEFEGGVVGIGILDAVSWRVAKSVGRRPSGMEGGQRR